MRKGLFDTIPNRRLVEIWWVDSNGRDRWHPYDDKLDPSTAGCKTVGYVLSSDREFLRVASTISDDEFCLEMAIPRGCIKKVRRLDR